MIPYKKFRNVYMIGDTPLVFSPDEQNWTFLAQDSREFESVEYAVNVLVKNGEVRRDLGFIYHPHLSADGTRLRYKTSKEKKYYGIEESFD